MFTPVLPGAGKAILARVVPVGIVLAAIPLFITRTWTGLFVTHLFIIIALGIFISTRHIRLTGQRRPLNTTTSASGKIRRRPLDYHLFVLGSGGHTKEMLMMMDDGFCDFQGFHRRYLVSSGDGMSENHLEDYEEDLRALCKQQAQDPGTYDKCMVTRARRVHQPLWSTPFTALLSILDIFPVLLSPPRNEVGEKLHYPTYIFSNGPATGFFVGLAAHLLKIFYLVPEHVMKVVYIESWARLSTLSLTGKLFYYTGTVDVFLVQHSDVAGKYSVKNAGEMVFNSRRPAR